MQRYSLSFLIVVLLLLPQRASAQFFDFGFGGDPFGQRREWAQQRQQYKQPVFKGGGEGINRFLRKEFRAPADADPRTEGRVVVACIVNEKGRVVETHVVRSLGAAFDKEAQRVCTKMKFKPARQGKKKVKSRIDITFPIRRGRLSFNTLSTADV